MINSPKNRKRQSKRLWISPRQTGLSLIELMISITLGLIVLAGITTLIVNQSSNQAELEKSSRQIENGRYAMQVLQEDIQLAGYFGEYASVSTDPGVPGTLPDPCSLTSTEYKDVIALHFQGYNDVGASMPSPPSGCLGSANHLAGTDILVIRRAGTATVPVANAVADQPYIQTGIDPTSKVLTYKIGVGNSGIFTLLDKSGAISSLRPYIVNIYYVSPCSTSANTTCTANDDGIPTLKRLVLGSGPAFTTESLAEGIENLQIDYGIDTSNTGEANCYVSNPTSPATTEINACPTSAATYFGAANAANNWSNVMALRLNILARNLEKTGGYADGKTYALGLAGLFGPYSDGYKRHVFSGLVRAINPSGRREK